MKREEAVEEMIKVVQHYSGTRISDEDMMLEILNALEHTCGMSAPILPLDREDFNSDMEFECAESHSDIFGQRRGWE